MKVTKSIEHLDLECANSGKLEKLEQLAEAYLQFMQAVIDFYWENNIIPGEYVQDCHITTALSARYQQTAGLQAIRVVKSYWSKIQEKIREAIQKDIKEGKLTKKQARLYYLVNACFLWFCSGPITMTIKDEDNQEQQIEIAQEVLEYLKQKALEAKEEIAKPEIKNLTLELDAKVAQIEPSGSKTFVFWIKLSTLEFRKLIYIPIKLHKNAVKLLKKTKLKKIIRLKKREDGRWYASLVIEKEVKLKKKNKKKEVGVDVGVKALLVDSNGNYYGADKYDKLKREIDKLTEYHKRRQKLEKCIDKKHKKKSKGKSKPFKLPDKRYRKKQKRLSAWRKNEIGRAINQFVEKMRKQNNTVVLENLALIPKKTKSKKVNRILNRSLMGYLKDKLLFRIIDKALAYQPVQAAYSSQQCYPCGWVSRANRKTQEKFKCEICGHENHADLNASLVIKRRSRDKELNSIQKYWLVKELLLKRFSGAHSVSSWLDLDSFLAMSGKKFREVLNGQSATSKG